tara:strand:- start:187 stop:336 length:150 start_codon:yes stop_codon:yes gene_type:complete
VLAKTGGTPVDNKAGNVMKLPPPAREFNPPAKKAAKHTQSKSSCSTVIS